MRPCLIFTTALALLLSACGEPGPESAVRAPEQASTPQPSSSPAEPFPEDPLERRLAGGETHRYEIDLTAGDYLHAVVDQRGVDVEVEILGPADEEVLTLDTATPHGGTRGAEEVHFVADRMGPYVVVVRPLDSQAEPGRYEIRRIRQHPATPQDLLRTRAARLFFEAQSLTWTGSREDLKRSLEMFRRARELWLQSDEPRRRALTEHALGLALSKLKRWREAQPWLERSLPELRETGDAWRTATALHELAWLRSGLGEMDGVLELYAQALPLRRRAGDLRGEAVTLHELGIVHHYLGQFQEALEHYDHAYELFVQVRDLSEQANTLHNRGRLYAQLGRLEEARLDFETALELRRELSQSRRLAITLDALARLHARKDDTSAALSYLERARRLREEAEDARGLAVTWRSLGIVHQKRGDLLAAHTAYQRSLELLETLDEPRQLARIRREMGTLELELGRPDPARELFQAALEHFRTARDVHGEIDVLAGLAHAQKQLGRRGEALRRSQEVLLRLETLQAEPETYTLRSSYLASQQDHCDFHIELLMEAGDAAAALEANEGCRGRALLAFLEKAGAERFAEADPAGIEQERELARQIRALESHRLDLLDGETLDGRTASPERIASLGREIRQLLAERTRLRARLAAQSPRRASLTEPPLLSAQEVQRTLEEPRTLLLEYRLGTSQSFLWAVTGDRLESFVLPGREEIETRVRRAHQLLSGGNRVASAGRLTLLLEDLSTTLLEPASELLRSTPRVVIVGDGLLSLVPFSALPMDGRPLVETHEMVQAPSFSILAVLERRSPTEFPAGTLAVLADPVFSPDDPRIPGKSREVAAADLPSVLRGAKLTRLTHSGREAERILRRVPASASFHAVGFDARRDLVTGGRLAGFRILHFATHARVHLERPELSHLAFSRWSPSGQRVEGLLFAHELFGLDFPADLVVLSACDTALGQHVRGEGLVGLTQGFFHAGASRVMATLWPVEDEATAELMDRFYGYLLEEELPPARALRRAQIDIKKEPRWEAPYYWAGFVLQGR